MDLDSFSRFNDRLGRRAGDAYLRQAVERITKSFRTKDFIARLRADDFAAMAQGLSSGEAEQICRNLIDAFSIPFSIEGFQIIGSVRIGVTSFPGGGRSAEELRFSAEAALSEAKRGEGSRFVVCSPEIRARMASVVDAGRRIRQARDASSSDLFYQPQIKIGGELAGMEAVVRIRPVEGGPVAASSSVKLEEHSGTVTEIYPWVLPEAMRQYGEWLHSGLNPVRIAVLVSQTELRDGKVLERILSCLKTFGLGTAAIQIELPEPAAALSDETLLHILRELRNAGVSITLDVFGAGFAPPGCLDGLPVDAIKINKVFVGRLTEPDSSMSAVSAMIAGARVLRMTTIAEGIETEEQMWALRRMGCDVLQGCHVAQPLSALDAEAALATRLKTHEAGRDWVLPTSLSGANSDGNANDLQRQTERDKISLGFTKTP
jgi:diguanylate cyclase (GGDEF)-like protein